MRGARLLTLLGGKRRYRTSSFANWTPVVGAAADGVASALGDWLGNLVVNGEFTEDTAGWGPARTINAWVDAAVEPGVPSGGADNGAIRITKTTEPGSGSSYADQIISADVLPPSAEARVVARMYWPSTTSEGAAPTLYIFASPDLSSRVTLRDEWELLSVTRKRGGSYSVLLHMDAAGALGDIIYADSVAAYRQNTPLLSPHRAASGVWTWSIAQPASDVVPWSALVRYAGTGDYWEVRTKPNTDGNDLELVEVVAGVETVRAAADVDWTAGETDELRITARGTTIGVEHRKHGEAVWTAGLSYASATAHQTAGQYGQMQWGTGEKRAASVRWDK